ncbi:O-acetyl-ADP-ribose deacetylase [Patescibacteria group bacterium]|nr:O-acetyl-ADP-ribose deacetylase [Patescibacteria group bacterium]
MSELEPEISSKVEIVEGDITKLKVDAIVNAANESLLGGGGVDGAIHRAAGPKLLEECRTLGGCEPGQVKATLGYELPAKYVIHTVGPVWQGGDKHEAETLKDCYLNSLKLAEEKGAKIIAFPNISTGIYGYPKDEAAEIAIDVVETYLRSSEKIEKVIFVCFDEENYNLYNEILTRPS